MAGLKLILCNRLWWITANRGLRNDSPLTLSLDPIAVTRVVILSFVVCILQLSHPPPFTEIFFLIVA